MLIRLATHADLPQLLALIRRVVPAMQATGNFQWDATYPNESVFRDDIDRQQLWVADVAGELAGVTALTDEQYAEYAQVGWDITEPAVVTHRLAVDPAFRGRGVAKALVLQADAVARQRGLALLRIDTNTQNQVAQRLFSGLGYVYAGDFDLAFRPGLRFSCYEKRLH